MELGKARMNSSIQSDINYFDLSIKDGIKTFDQNYFGNGKKLEVIECPGLMIGVAYTIFTQNLGLGPGYLKAGSTMGLAAYGKPLPVLTKKLEEYINNCFFERFSTIDYRDYFKNLILVY